MLVNEDAGIFASYTLTPVTLSSSDSDLSSMYSASLSLRFELQLCTGLLRLRVVHALLSAWPRASLAHVRKVAGRRDPTLLGSTLFAPAIGA